MTALVPNYQDYLPHEETPRPDSLGEGQTPLVRSAALGDELGLPNLYFKSEHLNPTGSFKDRFAAVEVALMREAGIKSCLATSSGNTGSALAAYAARHGIQCHIFVNEMTPANKLTQMLIHGAKLYRVRGFGVSADQSRRIFERIQELSRECNTRLVVSAYEYSPAGMDGVKSIAYELVEQLGGVPDLVFVPVGGGGLLTAIWRGFVDLKTRNEISELPRIVAVQPQLNDTIVTPLMEGASKAQAIKMATTTTVSGLAVQVDIDATRALRAVRASRGWGEVVSDYECFAARQELCQREGLYVEAAGAISAAGLLTALAKGRVRADEKVVCLLTGHGFKDAAVDQVSMPGAVEELDISQLEAGLIEQHEGNERIKVGEAFH